MIPALISLVAIALMAWLTFEVTRADDPLLADEEVADADPADWTLNEPTPEYPVGREWIRWTIHLDDPDAAMTRTEVHEALESSWVWACQQLAAIYAEVYAPVVMERRTPGANLPDLPPADDTVDDTVDEMPTEELVRLRDLLVGKGVVRPAAPAHGDVTDEGLVRVA